jgi:hypothetical protein
MGKLPNVFRNSLNSQLCYRHRTGKNKEKEGERGIIEGQQGTVKVALAAKGKYHIGLTKFRQRVLPAIRNKIC